MSDVVQIIHIDGPDKSGKDAIKREIIKRTGGAIMVIARSFLSQTVYASIYDRDINSEGYWLKAKQAFQRGETLIYLRPEKNLGEIERRFKEHDEKDMDFENYTLHRTWFDRTVSLLGHQGCRYLQIDTTAHDISKCVDIILHKALSDYTKFCSNCLLHTLDVNQMEAKHGYGKLVPKRNDGTEFMIVGINPSNKRIPYNQNPFELTNDPQTHKNKPFWDALWDLGIGNRSYITNAVKCSTKNNRLKTVDFKCCEHILQAEIEFMRPKIIVAVGKEVATYLRGKLDRHIIEIQDPEYHNFTHSSVYTLDVIEKLKHHV